MSYPALRQPKCVIKPELKHKELKNQDSKFMVLTLKGDEKLVISSDAYHGVLMAGNMYNCVFCSTAIELQERNKELHITSHSHGDILKSYPHLQEFGNHLLRKLSKLEYYCTICNVVVLEIFIRRHIESDVHMDELQRAKSRASNYKSY